MRRSELQSPFDKVKELDDETLSNMETIEASMLHDRTTQLQQERSLWESDKGKLKKELKGVCTENDKLKMELENARGLLARLQESASTKKSKLKEELNGAYSHAEDLEKDMNALKHVQSELKEARKGLDESKAAATVKHECMGAEIESLQHQLYATEQELGTLKTSAASQEDDADVEIRSL